jgi:type IV pilus assembly protein PilE
MNLVARPTAHDRGFTLIELMITVAIVAILSMVAYPSYRDYVIRGHITDGINGLSAVRANMERHFQDNRTYATVGAFTTPCGTATTHGTFTVSCQGTPDGTTFTVQAVGSGPTNGFTFTINQLDVRATTAAPAGWATCATKWITKKGQAC